MKFGKGKKEKTEKKAKKSKKGMDPEMEVEEEDAGPKMEYPEVKAWLAAPEQGVQGIIFEFEGGFYRVISAEKYA